MNRHPDRPLRTQTCPKCGSVVLHTDLKDPRYRAEDGKWWVSCDAGHYFTLPRRKLEAK